jgi:hypothetical protein
VLRPHLTVIVEDAVLCAVERQTAGDLQQLTRRSQTGPDADGSVVQFDVDFTAPRLQLFVLVLTGFEQEGLHSTGKVDDQGPVLQVDGVVIRLFAFLFIQNRTVVATGTVFGALQVAGEQTKVGLPDRVVELFVTFVQGSGGVGPEILPFINRRPINCKCSSNGYATGGSEGFGTRAVSVIQCPMRT